MKKTEVYDVAIWRNSLPETAQIVQCVTIEGYSTVADLPKMIELRHGEGWEILAVQRVSTIVP